jgi:ubiquinone/menaquinone biosynthesis C-methylase UbiE
MGSKPGRFHDPAHAADYDRKAGRSDIRARLTPALVQAVAAAAPARALDLAAGTGRFTYPAATALPKALVVALDEARAMLRVARERGAGEPARNVAWVSGRAEALPFRPGAFDCVFTAFAFHHFAAASAVLGEVARVTRAGGTVLILEPILPEPRDSLDLRVNEAVNEILERATEGGFVHRTANEIERLLAEAGFGLARTEVHPFAIEQDGLDGVPTGRHWLEIAEGIAARPKQVRERFEQRFFRWERRGGVLHVGGTFLFGLVSARREGGGKG